MSEQQMSEPVNFDDEIVVPCLRAERKQWEAAAAADLRTLEDWIRTRLEAAANRELRGR